MATLNDIEDGTDVSAYNLDGAAEVQGAQSSVIVHSLAAGRRYRLLASAELSGGNTETAALLISVPAVGAGWPFPPLANDSHSDAEAITRVGASSVPLCPQSPQFLCWE